MYRMLGDGGAVRILVVDVTALAQETCGRHGVPPAELSIVGESTVVHALLGLYMKGDEELTLNVRLDRPEIDYLAQMEGTGHFRARVNIPEDRLSNEGNTLVGGMMVMKSLAAKVLHQGVSLVHHESLEAAFRSHLAESLQVDAALRIGVETESGAVTYAGGVLVERLPEADGRASLSSQDFHARFGAFEERPVRDIAAELHAGQYGGQPVETVEERSLVWRCQCSEERTEAVLSLLGYSDLLALAEEQDEANITCHFCCTTWSVSSQRIRELAEGLEALEG